MSSKDLPKIIQYLINEFCFEYTGREDGVFHFGNSSYSVWDYYIKVDSLNAVIGITVLKDLSRFSLRSGSFKNSSGGKVREEYFLLDGNNDFDHLEVNKWLSENLFIQETKPLISFYDKLKR